MRYNIHFTTTLSFCLLTSTSSFANIDSQDLNKKIEWLESELTNLKIKVNNNQSQYKINLGLERFQLDYNQFEGGYNSQNNGANASDLFPRRVRAYAKSEIDDWSYFLLTDFQDNRASITIARLTYSGFDNGPLIKLGKIREDISLEALSSSKHITTISRSMLANMMSPYYNYGVSASQYFKNSGLRYAVGIYKADDFGSDGYGNSGSLNFSLTGRLSWAPINNGTETLHLATWFSSRDFGSNSLGAKFARGEVRNANVRLLDYAAGGSTFKVDSMEQYGFEFAGVYGPFSLQAEYAKREVDAVDSENDNSYDGYYATASYFVTGESRKYKTIGTFTTPIANSLKGAIELYARFSTFDATSKLQGTVIDVTTIGVTYYLNKKMKFLINYLNSNVSGPGANFLVGENIKGKALTVRIQYLF
jgi:phosphate-selective porin OprO/OprP